MRGGWLRRLLSTRLCSARSINPLARHAVARLILTAYVRPSAPGGPMGPRCCRLEPDPDRAHAQSAVSAPLLTVQSVVCDVHSASRLTPHRFQPLEGSDVAGKS